MLLFLPYLSNYLYLNKTLKETDMKYTLRGIGIVGLAIAAGMWGCPKMARAQPSSGWGEPAKAQEALAKVPALPTPVIHAGKLRPMNLAAMPALFPKTIAEQAWVASGVVGLNILLDAGRPKDEEYSVSVHFGGWTDHDKPGKCVKGGKLCIEYRNRNPIVGVTVWLWDFAGGRSFAEAARVLTNSLMGTTDWAMLGVKWTLHRGQFVDVCAAVGVAHVKARLPFSVPGLEDSQSDTRIAGYACLERGPVALRATPITTKDWTFNLVYSF